MRPAIHPRHTRGGGALTDLILDVFRLNGRLLSAGDRLTQDMGLTSARWQVIGAVALAETPQPVAHIARRMGLTRQSVQRIVNELEGEGLVEFTPNPNHQRAKLVMLTRKGTTAYQRASQRQAPWANRLADGVKEKNLKVAIQVIRRLTKQLEGAEGSARKRFFSKERRRQS